MNFELLKCFRLLLLDFSFRLIRSQHAPHLVERIHVEWQVILLALIVSNRRIRITVKLHNGVHKVPHLLIGCMEDMCPILMHIDTLNVLTIDVAAQMRTLVYHQTLLTHLLCPIGKRSAEQSGTHYQIIVFHFFHHLHHSLSFCASCKRNSRSLHLMEVAQKTKSVKTLPKIILSLYNTSPWIQSCDVL